MARKDITDGRLDLISGLLKPDTKVSDTEYRSTAQTFIFAGSETTATLLTELTYFLLTHPEKLKKLVDEIRLNLRSLDDINAINVNKLTYLSACIHEALRFYPPVGDSFPRNTEDTSEMICSHLLPPNVRQRLILGNYGIYSRSLDHVEDHDVGYVPLAEELHQARRIYTRVLD